MKHFKKGLLGVMVITAMTLMAAEDRTIHVNTFEDEDNVNMNQCSLREAIKTASLNKAYGGCSAGNTGSGQTDYIQLAAGTYKLNKEIVPESKVVVFGKSPYLDREKNPITFKYPALGELTSRIDAGGKSRLFNTITKTSLTLENVILENGYSADEGGALLVGGALTLNNVQILNSKSDKKGGALYLVGSGEHQVTVNNSVLQGNQATVGSVLAMQCYAGLLDVKTNIEFRANSIISNGQISNLNTFDFCGNPKVAMANNTIAKNTVNTLNGSILYAVNTREHNLSLESSFLFSNNTIVENSAASVLDYDDFGMKSLYYNVLAYNGNTSCRYVGSQTLSDKYDAGVTAGYNAFDTVTSQCELAASARILDGTTDTNIDVKNVAIGSLLSSLTAPSKYNLFRPMYFPKVNSSGVDLLDTNSKLSCNDSDQRGLDRIVDGTLMLAPAEANSCDIGSVELRRLAAADIADLKNTSQAERLQAYENNIKELEGLIADKNTNPDFLIEFNEELKRYKELLAATKLHQKYRAIYVNPFQFVLQDEAVVNTADGTSALKEMNTENYTITETQVLGVGVLSAKDGVLDTSKLRADPTLRCEWKDDLKQIMIYRTDGKPTTSTEYVYCQYSVKSNATQATSSGILKAEFSNIQPIAKTDEYTLNYGGTLKLNLNPLVNDSDDGDGPISTVAAEHQRPAFHRDANGKDLAIRIVRQDAGINIKPERTGSCPGEYEKYVCYGGNIEVEVRNNFSPFPYEIEYVIYDAEAEESKSAMMYFTNTAKNTNTEASGGGGGSMGGLGVLGLLSLAWLRQRRKI
ncbi:CSLREA domain-containing protein [Acinetobacter johnsonii]|uniref:CSLREA domain-containing protein n=1 Tax=Acinetobacter johnsonii TaxID=40214 RepID=UPI002448806C|nr:CSLREA domain-containing protein [Acinetobacter johnsonii]MDH1407340.1 CSLREA domain-containing protein [Acinetobacter johnsonii]